MPNSQTLDSVRDAARIIGYVLIPKDPPVAVIEALTGRLSDPNDLRRNAATYEAYEVYDEIVEICSRDQES